MSRPRTGITPAEKAARTASTGPTVGLTPVWLAAAPNTAASAAHTNAAVFHLRDAACIERARAAHPRYSSQAFWMASFIAPPQQVRSRGAYEKPLRQASRVGCRDPPLSFVNGELHQVVGIAKLSG